MLEYHCLYFSLANAAETKVTSFSLNEIKEALQKTESSKRAAHLQQFLINLKEAKAQLPPEQSGRMFTLSQTQMLVEPIVELTAKAISADLCEETKAQIEGIVGHDRGPEGQWPNHATHAFALLALFCK